MLFLNIVGEAGTWLSDFNGNDGSGGSCAFDGARQTISSRTNEDLVTVIPNVYSYYVSSGGVSRQIRRSALAAT